jgi:hypothetical protein
MNSRTIPPVVPWAVPGPAARKKWSNDIKYFIMKDSTNAQHVGNNNSAPFKISGDWKAQSKVLKEKFPQLTDADLSFESGKEEDLLKKVETRLNKKREEVVNIIRKGQPVSDKS